MATSKPTDRHTHTHFRNAVPLPWGSLRLAPIKRNLECARRNNPQVDKLEQAREGNANEDHFANTQLLQITIQKCGTDMKRTIKNIRHGTASYRIHSASPLIRHSGGGTGGGLGGSSPPLL